MGADLDDDDEKDMTTDQYNDCNDDDDDMYSSMLDTLSIICLDDAQSCGTATPNLPTLQPHVTNAHTVINAANNSRREYTEILPLPQRFIQMIRESAPQMWNDQVSDTDLANVIYESFPELLSQPDIPVALDQLLTYIIAQRQPNSPSEIPFVLSPLEPKPLVQPQTQLKSGKQLKDRKAHRMKNRPFGLKYKVKDKSNKVPKNAPSAKAKQKMRKKTKKAEDDYVTNAAKQQRRDHDNNGSGAGGGIGGTCAC